MTRRYLRSIRVAVGDGGDEIVVRDLKMAFDIRREATSTPAAGEIDIVNLAPESEARISPERGARLRLWAGYGDDPPLLADGEVRRLERMRIQINRVTRLHFGGSAIRLAGPIFVHSYSGIVSIREIVTDIVDTLGLELGPLDAIPEDATEENIPHAGPARFYLTARLRPLGVEWYESDGIIYFTRRSDRDSDQDAATNGSVTVISERSGMIGTPTLTDDGVTVRTLLAPHLRLGSRFRVESVVVPEELAQTTWKAVVVSHRGDNRDGEFVTEAEGRRQ